MSLGFDCLKNMPLTERLADWPELRDSTFEISSEPTVRYNCVAWAIGETQKWIDAFSEYYWPSHLPNTNTPDNYASFFRLHGFEICSTSDLEEGIQKLAIYANAGNEFTHVALQCADGTWTSKLGKCEDIWHSTTESLNGPFYGNVAIYMARPRESRRGEV